MLVSKSITAILLCTGVTAIAQETGIQFYRPNNQQGLNIFETLKNDTVGYRGLKVNIGGNFDLAFQALNEENTAKPVTPPGFTSNINTLLPIVHGFQLPAANMVINVQLADGVRMNLTLYLSSRHHLNTWVKGGYIQFDKLPFLHSHVVDNIMKSVTINIGQNDVDYGDQHYRRTDGGNTIYNPFVENYIMDEFATEIGAQIYYHNPSGFFLMGGITDGQLDATVNKSTTTVLQGSTISTGYNAIDSATNKLNKYEPAFVGKIGFDKQVSNDFRMRLTGSFYTINSAQDNTLFFGDRTGSHYFNVMESQAISKITSTANVIAVQNDYYPWSGRLNPEFSEEVHAVMGNLFLKYKGLEFFGTAENAKGRAIKEKVNRKATQYAADIIYRFPQNKQNFWVAFRYNTVKLPINGGGPNPVTVNRQAASVGWFLTKNIMVKAEYVNQEYKDYLPYNILNGGKFHGICLEASIAF
ncbi:MAG: hypothetical protein KGM16_02330 [Bacteroidota bacterium]|nr:hypothetical protein [Bacteroidota bacterium]